MEFLMNPHFRDFRKCHFDTIPILINGYKHAFNSTLWFQSLLNTGSRIICIIHCDSKYFSAYYMLSLLKVLG